MQDITWENIPSLSTIDQLNPNLQSILWDMDGTIMDSESWHNVALIHFVQKFMNSTLTREHIENRLWGRTDFQVYDLLSEIFDKKVPCSIDEFLEYKYDMTMELIQKNANSVFPQSIRELLERCQSKYTMALVTSSEKNLTHKLDSVFDFHRYFNLIITRDDVIRTKPDPFPYQLAIQNLSLNPKTCLIFEDSPTGLAAAKASGVSQVIRANWFSPCH